MTLKQLKELLECFKAYESNMQNLYDVGINLLDSKYSIQKYIEQMLDITITSHYGEEGLQWIHWWIYENAYGKLDMLAYDNNGNRICDTLENLHNYLETHCKNERKTKVSRMW